jgi:quercetinase-like protein
VVVNGAELTEGDGAAISNERSINIVGKAAAEVLLFEVA